MTSATTSAPAFRFKFVDDQTDLIYVGEAEIDISSGEVTILSAWEIGMTVEEIFPYAKGFSLRLRHQLEQAALECRMTPVEIELPSDWDEVVVVDSETIVTVEARCILPEVSTDTEAAQYGLSTVRRIKQTGPKKYRVTAKGPLSNIQRELFRARLF